MFTYMNVWLGHRVLECLTEQLKMFCSVAEGIRYVSSHLLTPCVCFYIALALVICEGVCFLVCVSI